MRNLGYDQSKNDYSLFTKSYKNTFTIIAVYVDDVLITGNSTEEIETLKRHLHKTFTIKDLGRLHYFLGLEVSYMPEGIVLTQRKFTKDLLQVSGVTTFKKAVSPLPLNIKLSAHEGTLRKDPHIYKSLIGKLNFMTHTRSDLSYTVQNLSQFMQSPRDSHWKALMHTLNYVHYTCGQGFVIQGSNKLTLRAYSDLD